MAQFLLEEMLPAATLAQQTVPPAMELLASPASPTTSSPTPVHAQFAPMVPSLSEEMPLLAPTVPQTAQTATVLLASPVLPITRSPITLARFAISLIA